MSVPDPMDRPDPNEPKEYPIPIVTYVTGVYDPESIGKECVRCGMEIWSEGVVLMASDDDRPFYYYRWNPCTPTKENQYLCQKCHDECKPKQVTNHKRKRK